VGEFWDCIYKTVEMQSNTYKKFTDFDADNAVL